MKGVSTWNEESLCEFEFSSLGIANTRSTTLTSQNARG